MDVLNSRQFHFDSIWNLVVTFLTEGQEKHESEKTDTQSASKNSWITKAKSEVPPPKNLVAYYASKITITKDSQIISRETHKIYKCVNTKGLIDTETSIVYPFGFQSVVK